MTEEMTVKDLELTMVLRNNQLKERREKLGFTQHQMAEAAGVSHTAYQRFECLTLSPLLHGEWRGSARAIANFFNVKPAVLWPEAVLAVKAHRAVRRINALDMQLLMSEPPKSPEEALLAKEQKALLQAAKEQLPYVKRYFLEEWVENERTLDDIAKSVNLSRERVRSIAQAAMGNIRADVTKGES